MSDFSLKNPVILMWNQRGKTVTSFGKDTTGKIKYSFNDLGFRSSKIFDFVPDYAFFGCSFVLGIGVEEEKTFASKFKNSQNYGVGSLYDNEHIFQTIKNFVNSKLYSPDVKIAVFWTDRDPERLDGYYQQLLQYNLIHVFCGKPLLYPRCYPMIKNLDWDVSGTHIGELTHQFLYKFLCQTFDQ
jgi:hypothetical protein